MKLWSSTIAAATLVLGGGTAVLAQTGVIDLPVVAQERSAQQIGVDVEDLDEASSTAAAKRGEHGPGEGVGEPKSEFAQTVRDLRAQKDAGELTGCQYGAHVAHAARTKAGADASIDTWLAERLAVCDAGEELLEGQSEGQSRGAERSQTAKQRAEANRAEGVADDAGERNSAEGRQRADEASTRGQGARSERTDVAGGEGDTGDDGEGRPASAGANGAEKAAEAGGRGGAPDRD